MIRVTFVKGITHLIVKAFLFELKDHALQNSRIKDINRQKRVAFLQHVYSHLADNKYLLYKTTGDPNTYRKFLEQCKQGFDNIAYNLRNGVFKQSTLL